MVNVKNFEQLPTKEKILRVSADIIVNEGLKKFTARNVADRLGITDAAIFKHFRSMDDIIFEIIERYVSRCSRSADEAEKTEKSIKERLYQILKTHISVLEETKGAVPVLCFEFLRSDDKKFYRILKEFIETYKRKVGDLIREGQSEGVIRKSIDPEGTAMLFIGLIQAKVFAYLLDGKKGNIVDDPEQFISEIFYGIIEKDDRDEEVEVKSR
ncbi:MAG: TetR/AcrR family transcriptional regulator [Persephonella sp.]|nr:MAG: TetR/AcrR family transcriptional regulator [Persephonella sp.]RUM60051.1 MAG: TetR/AcrR family transcriptional regulator [Persephonella sp.]